MVGERVRNLRRQRGMTQVTLSRQAKLTQQAISDIESGRVKNPGSDTLQKLSAGLGVSIEELTGIPVAEPLSEAEWTEVRRAWDALSLADQRNMLSVIRRLAVAVDVTAPDLRDLDEDERETVMSSEPELRLAVANALRQLRQIDREASPLGELREQQPRQAQRRARRS